MTVVAEKKASKYKAFEPDGDKVYEFQLLTRYHAYQPKEKGNPNISMANGFPPVYIIPNSGNVIDPASGNVRAFRLLAGETSIWADEQPSLKDAEPREIARRLAESENQLEFLKGSLMVRGVEKNKIKVLLLQDDFEGKEGPQYRQKNPLYKLTNPDEDVKKELTTLNDEYFAMNKAYTASREEMLEFAYALGINVDDVSEAGLNRIKTEFVKRAKSNPNYFKKWFENPGNKIKYNFYKAIKQDVLSFSQQQNTLTWAEANQAICTVNGSGDVIAELTEKVIKKDKEMTKVYETLLTVLE